MTRAAPSMKKLTEEVGLSKDQARLVRQLIKGEIRFDCEALFPKTAAWAKDCHHYPNLTRADAVMGAIDETAEGHGVEVFGRREEHDNYWGDTRFLYVNRGDVYRPTVVYGTEADRYFVDSVGNLAEKEPDLK